MQKTPQRTDIDLEEFRVMLQDERHRLTDLYKSQQSDIRGEMEDASDNEMSHTDAFDGSENDDTAAMLADRDRDTAQLENVRQILAEVEHALDRIAEGTYGICEATGSLSPSKGCARFPGRE